MLKIAMGKLIKIAGPWSAYDTYSVLEKALPTAIQSKPGLQQKWQTADNIRKVILNFLGTPKTHNFSRVSYGNNRRMY